MPITLDFAENPRLATQMDRRTHEGPMDFEYQNGTGPMDGRSPFAQISMNQQRSTNGGGSDNSAKKRGMFLLRMQVMRVNDADD